MASNNSGGLFEKTISLSDKIIISPGIPSVVRPSTVQPEGKSITPPKITSILPDTSSKIRSNSSDIQSIESVNSTENTLLNNITELELETLVTINGELMTKWDTGPGLPPENWQENQNVIKASDYSITSLDMTNVPAMKWVYGCSPTAASMLFGYYDRTGYSDIYTGPTNGGVFPLTNYVWGEITSSSGKCPMTASELGVDGRTIKGHKDDYYYSSGSTVDPYYNNWLEHTPLDCLADFMGTNMYQKYSNIDGSTTFWFYSDGSPTYDFTQKDSTSRDGMHGMKLFAESRGYSVLTNYNQYIDSFGATYGFTFDQYKAEINAGYPVLIQLTGHTVLGVGYSGTNQVIIHDTWDYSTHTMTWGGTYSGMTQYAVGVIHLDPSDINPLEAKFYGVPDVEPYPLTVQFYDVSTGNPNSWSWSFGDGGSSTDQNPTYTYYKNGTHIVNLTISRD